MADTGATGEGLLPSELAERIFREDIAATVLVLAAGQLQPQPMAIVLCAQAGAGKTQLAGLHLSAAMAARGGSVSIDVDMFRVFYPDYERMKAHDEIAADDVVHGDARRWLDRSVEHLTGRRVNIIIEHGLRSTTVAEGLLARLDKAGYRIEIALMSTPAAVSRLSILERYQVGREKTGRGRYVDEELHDHRYAHVAAVADWCDADPRVSAIAIYERGGNRVYENRRDATSRWMNAAATRDELELARRRPWGRAESEAFLRLHGSLAARMAPQWQAALRHAHAAATPLLHPEAGRGPSHTREAVTYGRYQIVSIAHLDTIRTMLRDWPKVTIGVIDMDARPRVTPPEAPASLAEFYRVALNNTVPERNPMTLQERRGLWQAALDTAGIADRVTVEAVPMPELAPAEFNSRFPPDRYDVLFPAASDAELAHTDRGSILSRTIYSTEPPLEFHTSTIRESYRSGSQVWRARWRPALSTCSWPSKGPSGSSRPSHRQQLRSRRRPSRGAPIALSA